MKILIVAPGFSSRISGIQRHAFNVVRCLLQQREVSAVCLVLAPWQRDMAAAACLPASERLTIRFEEMMRGSTGRNLWYYRRLPVLARALEVDLVHLTYPAPLNARAFMCPVVTTLHDLYPYEIPLNFGFPKFILNRLVLRQCLYSASAIACVSDTTLARLAQFLPTAAGKAVRIYNCVEAPDVPASGSTIRAWKGSPFLLFVAQHRRNKNIPLLIDVFHQLLRSGSIDASMQLLVVGIRGPETTRIVRQIARRGIGSRVLLLEGISDAELQWCYARCEALVSPSSTEGFGLPIAEALLAGCRVICSDIPAHREVGDGRCRFVPLDGQETRAFADAIVAALREPRVEPITLPHLAASVLGKQYVALYRGLLTSAHVKGAQAYSAAVIDNSERQLL